MAGCKQVFCYAVANSPTANTSVSVASGNLAAGDINEPWLVTGDFRNLKVTLTSAPGVGKSYTFTLYVDDNPTSLSVTISDAATTASDTTHKVYITSGSVIRIKRLLAGGPAGIEADASIEFNGATAGHSGYCCGNAANLASNTATNTAHPLGLNAWVSSGATLRYVMCSLDGDLTTYRVDLTSAPGTGKSWTFQWLVNGVAQTGAAGTVDTRLAITDAATSGTWTGTLPLAKGDYLQIQAVPSGTPTTPIPRIGFRVVADNDGESLVGAGTASATPTTGTNYNRPVESTLGWSATEAARDVQGGISSFDLIRLYIRTTSGPGSGDTWTFTTRKNGAGGGQSCALTGAGNTGNDTAHTVTIGNGDSWALEEAYSGAGSANAGIPTGWGWCMYAASAYVPLAVGRSFGSVTVF